MSKKLAAKISLPNKKQHSKRRARSNKTSRKSAAPDRAGHRTANSVAITYMPIFNTAVKKRLTYFDSGSLTVNVGLMASHVFAVNGLYDPNVTGVGHQPAGFDQMMVFFDHYVVTHAKATVTWFNVSANSAQVALSLNSTVTPVTDYTVLCETGYVTRDYVNQVGTVDNIKTMSLSCNVSKFQGVPVVRDDPELWGNAAANPVELSFFNLSGWDIQGGSSTIRFTVLIEFEAWFIEPRKVSSSLAQSLHRLLLADEKSNTCAPSLGGTRPAVLRRQSREPSRVA